MSGIKGLYLPTNLTNPREFGASLSFGFLCLLAALLPFEAYGSVGSVWGLTPLKLLFVLSCLVFVVSGVWRNQSHLPPLLWAAALVCASLLISAAAAPEYKQNAAKSFVRYASGLALFLQVFYLTQGRPKRRRILAGSLWVGALVSAILGLAIVAGFRWTVGFSRLFRPFEYYVYFNRRLGATFEYPNTAADYFVLTLPLALAWAIGLKPAKRIAGLLAVAGPLILALAWTYSRGGLVASLLALLGTALWMWRSAARAWAPYFAGAALLLGLLFLPLNYNLPRRDSDPQRPELPAIDVCYELAERRFQREPDQMYDTEIKVTNSGTLPWTSTPREPLVVSYRWYSVDNKKLVWVDEIPAELPPLLRPGETARLQTRYRTPHEGGYYYLIWDIFQYEERMPWSTRRKIIPGIAECFIAASPLDLDALPHTDPNRPADKSDTSGDPGDRIARFDLWRAAAAIFRQHPILGIGGGNFRLVYGRYLGLKGWDQRIHANSLFMETAANSGIIGLAALAVFAAAMAKLVRQQLLVPPCRDQDSADWLLNMGLLAALAGFALHNLIDYFLEFTPTYFAFWIILGLAASGARESPA